MRILPLIKQETSRIRYGIKRGLVEELINKIGSYNREENLINFIKENWNKKDQTFHNEVLLDSMASCDPGITIRYRGAGSHLDIDEKLGKNKSNNFTDFTNCVLFWEDSFVQIIVVVDGKVWNSSIVVYIKSKLTNEVRRSLIIDSEDIYVKYNNRVIKINLIKGNDEEVRDKIYNKSSKDDQVFLHYREIRPIVRGVGEDIEDYPNNEDWVGGYYEDITSFGWFIKYVFNCGRARIIEIEN